MKVSGLLQAQLTPAAITSRRVHWPTMRQLTGTSSSLIIDCIVYEVKGLDWYSWNNVSFSWWWGDSWSELATTQVSNGLDVNSIRIAIWAQNVKADIRAVCSWGSHICLSQEPQLLYRTSLLLKTKLPWLILVLLSDLIEHSNHGCAVEWGRLMALLE